MARVSETASANWKRTLAKLRRYAEELRRHDWQVQEPPNAEVPPHKRGLPPAPILEEVDRNARAYGWEVGHGRPLNERFDSDPSNPFLDPEWRNKVPPSPDGVL